ncbi:MAG TPA: selenoneine synthase SenA [Alphaproteobacteria bacterium]|nr:selenoneine synthase SenA [Alphaproteobacteria bacterium]
MTVPMATARLVDYLADARARTLELVQGLDAGQLMGPRLDIVNPLLWEIGHVAWFYEHFALQRLDGGPKRLPEADALYNSSTVPHARRWELPLPSLQGTLDYMARVHEAMVGRLDGARAGAEETALYLLSIYHEDMHDEAFTYTRQTLGYPAPIFAAAQARGNGGPEAGPFPGDAHVPGGELQLGAPPEAPFLFDNEKWAHPVRVDPFRIARAPVTNAEFLAFVTEGGYRRREFWGEEGWRWREAAGAEHPLYWSPRRDGWSERRFNRDEPLHPHRPVAHVNWYEAMAWCRWAGRRLPSEAEWEAAAATEPGPGGGLAARKRRYPWGDETPDPRRANLDGAVLGTVDVAAHPEGDSAWGCRQMLGNVWEWTATTFEPYPGFAPDAYEDYSAPWFGSRKVLRGGAWATRSRMITNTYRNFFTPERRDVFAGFRTCAV